MIDEVSMNDRLIKLALLGRYLTVLGCFKQKAQVLFCIEPAFK